ncbi:MAG: sensor histidine kinase [Sarcina sp.]
MEGLVDIAFSLLEFIIIMMYRNIIFGDKLFKYFNYSVGFGILAGSLNYFIPVSFSYFAFILIFSLHVILFLIISKKKVLSAFIEILLGTLFTILVQAIILFFYNLIFDGSNKLFVYFNILGQIVIIGLLYKEFRYIFERYRNFITNEYSVGLLGLNSLFVFIIIKILYDNVVLDKNLIFVIMGLFILFLVSTIYLCKKIIKEVKRRNRLEVENEFKPILERYLDEMRAKEHEYKNHLNTLYMMSEVESVQEKLTSYIKEIKEDTVVDKILHVKNTFVKAVLYSSLCRVKELGVKMDLSILVDFKNIKLADTDLVIIFSNLLNNAIDEACKSENKNVNISVYNITNKDDDIYHIIVENSLDRSGSIDINKLASKGYSTKGEGRGYGLYNINKIVKSVNGKLVIDRLEDKITIEVII